MTREEMINQIKLQCKTTKLEEFEHHKNMLIEDIIDCEDMYSLKDYLLNYLIKWNEMEKKKYEEEWKDK